MALHVKTFSYKTELYACRTFTLIIHVIGDCLPSQSTPGKQNQFKKKNTYTFAHLVNFSKNVSAMFDSHKILNKLLHVLALDLRFVQRIRLF